VTSGCSSVLHTSADLSASDLALASAEAVEDEPAVRVRTEEELVRALLHEQVELHLGVLLEQVRRQDPSHDVVADDVRSLWTFGGDASAADAADDVHLESSEMEHVTAVEPESFS